MHDKIASVWVRHLTRASPILKGHRTASWYIELFIDKESQRVFPESKDRKEVTASRIHKDAFFVGLCILYGTGCCCAPASASASHFVISAAAVPASVTAPADVNTRDWATWTVELVITITRRPITLPAAVHLVLTPGTIVLPVTAPVVRGALSQTAGTVEVPGVAYAATPETQQRRTSAARLVTSVVAIVVSVADPGLVHAGGTSRKTVEEIELAGSGVGKVVLVVVVITVGLVFAVRTIGLSVTSPDRWHTVTVRTLHAHAATATWGRQRKLAMGLGVGVGWGWGAKTLLFLFQGAVNIPVHC